MTISSFKIDSILKEYTKQILPENAARKTGAPSQAQKPASSDTVSISDEGKKMIRERFEGEVLGYLRHKY